MDHNENLQHFNIAGVPDDVIVGVPNDDDPRPDIEAEGIPDDDLVGVSIAGVNEEQQQAQPMTRHMITVTQMNRSLITMM